PRRDLVGAASGLREAAASRLAQPVECAALRQPGGGRRSGSHNTSTSNASLCGTPPSPRPNLLAAVAVVSACSICARVCKPGAVLTPQSMQHQLSGVKPLRSWVIAAASYFS